MRRDNSAAEEVVGREPEAGAKIEVELVVGDAVGVEAAGALFVEDLGDALAPLRLRAVDVDGAVIVVVMERDDAELARELAHLFEVEAPLQQAAPQRVFVERIVLVDALDRSQHALGG